MPSPNTTTTTEQFRVSNLLKLSKQAAAMRRPDLASRALDAAAEALLPAVALRGLSEKTPGPARRWRIGPDGADTCIFSADLHGRVFPDYSQQDRPSFVWRLLARDPLETYPRRTIAHGTAPTANAARYAAEQEARNYA